MERRVLIVESQNDFALTMAATLKSVGYSTSLAGSAADAQRELEKRTPDVVVLRAELPDQSGFVLCGNIRKGRFGNAIPVILISSDVGPEALAQHSQSANAAHGYLAMPFDMGALAQLAVTFAPGASQAGADEFDSDLENALSGTGPQQSPVAGPPPLKTSGAGGPPKLPKRERRSALTDEDKSFLERAFSSIADRKAELLAESRELKRPAARRETMGTPEGKIQILRDELKVREAQIARISEVWSVRERELLSVEDRLNEKDVEIQGLKIQSDDLTKRINDASQNLIEKEREHGAQVEDLLLQKFIGEKEVIEVVSAKEKEINILRREKTAQEEELTRRSVEIDQSKKEFEQLEKDYQLATLEFEVKENELNASVQQQLTNIAELRSQLESAEQAHAATVSERDLKFADFDGQIQGLFGTIETHKSDRDRVVSELETNLAVSRDHALRGDQETERLQAELSDTRARSAEQIGNLEGELMGARQQLETLTAEKAESEQALQETVGDRENRIAKLESEFADITERKDRQEAHLQSEIQQRLERIGELEGEVEAVKAALAEREEELTHELNQLAQAKADAEGDLSSQLSQAHGLISEHTGSIAALETDLQGRHSHIQGLSADIESKSAHIEKLETNVAALQSAVSERDGEIAALKTAVSERESEIHTLEGSLAESTETLANTNVTLQETQQALLANQQALNETQAALEAKTLEQSETVALLQKTQMQLAQVKGDFEATEVELKEVSGQLAQLEQDKTDLEDTLNAQLGALKSSLAEAQGNYEAENAAHTKLQADTSAEIAQLESDAHALKTQLETTQVDLAATRANLDDVSKSLEIEQRAHSGTQENFEQRVAALDGDLSMAREHHEEISGLLSGTKQELGARVAELTQLNSQLAQADDHRHGLEERVASLTEESQRREELLQNDLAAKSKELADTIRKLTTLQQEKTRQVDALTRDANAKGEQIKQYEIKIKTVIDDAKKRSDEMTQKTGAMQGEIESIKKELTEKSDIMVKLGEEKTAFASERSELRTQIQTAQQQGNARVQESNAALQQEKAASKKLSDELSTRAQKAEARIAQVQQESTAKVSEYDARLKESQNQLAVRQKRVAELEQALEGASLTRTKAEKELQSKVAAAEQKANDAAVKLAAVAQEKKAVEVQKQKEFEDLQSKQRVELDRREQVKAQEVKRRT
jgi:ParB family transcriptional regulator, chromosome partitioning protein